MLDGQEGRVQDDAERHRCLDESCVDNLRSISHRNVKSEKLDRFYIKEQLIIRSSFLKNIWFVK